MVPDKLLDRAGRFGRIVNVEFLAQDWKSFDQVAAVNQDRYAGH